MENGSGKGKDTAVKTRDSAVKTRERSVRGRGRESALESKTKEKTSDPAKSGTHRKTPEPPKTAKVTSPKAERDIEREEAKVARPKSERDKGRGFEPRRSVVDVQSESRDERDRDDMMNLTVNHVLVSHPHLIVLSFCTPTYLTVIFYYEKKGAATRNSPGKMAGQPSIVRPGPDTHPGISREIRVGTRERRSE